MGPVRAVVVVALAMVTLVGCGRYSFDTVAEPTFPTSSPTTPSKPLERADVVGRWVFDALPERAYVVLGQRQAVVHDGCIPRRYGGWDLVHGRAKFRDDLPVRALGCSLPTAEIWRARSFALRGDVLVAFDRDGREIGRLHRPR